MPIVFSGKSKINLLIISSTKLDFPAPPVPVIPRTSVCLLDELFGIVANNSLAVSGKFSTAEIRRATALTFPAFNSLTSPFSEAPVSKSHCLRRSLIIP